MKTIEIDKLTRKDLREMDPGETVLFIFPNYGKVLSGRTTVIQVSKMENRRYSTAMGDRYEELYITRTL